MSEPIINKVAESGLVTIDLEQYLPKEAVSIFDMKDHLFMGLILKEKDFRQALKDKDWEEYRNKNVAVICSADAIIPVWAYMLVVSYLQPVAHDVFVGSPEEMHKHIVLLNIDATNENDYKEKRIVVKGCGDVPIDNYAYAAITKKLLSVVRSIMYGEPCSTVPVFKKKG